MNNRMNRSGRLASLMSGGAILALGLSLQSPEAASAQTTRESRQIVARDTSREALEVQLRQLEQISQSDSYDSASRLDAASQAFELRRRLDEGDFRPGDRIALVVLEDEALTDTFSVAREQMLRLPFLEDIPLRGVLRSELQQHLTDHIATIIRDPHVQATALTRLSVLGQVARPGFVLIDSDAALADALTMAGGPTQNAILGQMVIQRAGRDLWAAASFTAGTLDQQTIDQLGLQSGDQVMVPGQPPQGQSRGLADWLLITVPPLTAIVALLLRN